MPKMPTLEDMSTNCRSMFNSTCLRWTVLVVVGILLLSGWISLFFLFFTQDFLINENYAAKTVHLHKVTPNVRVPIEWNSLGPVTPLEQEPVHNSVEPVTYFVNDPPREATDASELNLAKLGKLGDPFGYTMYTNSERSFSVLSSICPSVYLCTLIVICDISLAYFFVALVERPSTKHADTAKHNWNWTTARDAWVSVTLLVYGLGLFAIFGAGASVKRVLWDIANVEYIISVQVPSVAYNILVLAMYGMYLKRKQSYWELIVADRDSMEKMPEKVPEMPEPQPPWMLSPDGMGSKFGANVHGMQPQSMYTYQPTLMVMPGQKQHLLMNTSGYVTSQNSKKDNKEDRGPVTNEFSVIVCVIVLLGGIANLGMTKAFLLETEAQLVILSLFMFCVLEIGRNHVVSYFWFLLTENQVSNAESKHNQEHRFIVVFIDTVVFLLQLFIVVIWQVTMTSLLATASANVYTMRGVLLFVITAFFLTRFISVIQGICELVNCQACVFDYSSTKAYQDILWYSELVMYCMIVFALIGFVFVVAVPKNEDPNPEKKLIFLEQMTYQSTMNPVTKADCSQGIQKSYLISNISTLCNFNSNDVYRASEPGPVSMKVFAWTRFFYLQFDIRDETGAHTHAKASADVLMCSNGFEQHWGQCKSHFLEPKVFWPEWDTKVWERAGL